MTGLGAILRTPRLTLRPLEVTDADALWPLVSDPEFPRHMSWDAHKDRAETHAWLADVVASREAGTDAVWAIVPQGLHPSPPGKPGRAPTPIGLEGSDAAAGTIGLHGIRHQFRAWRVDRAELGYWIAPSLHGRGLMTEAAREVMRFGFAELALHKITVGCVPENEGSRRVIEKLGFRFLCEHREHFFRAGRWWNQLSWELNADEWASG